MLARAIRRAGELLKQIMPSKGGRPELTSVGTGTSLTKNQHDSIACVGTDTTSFCKAGLGT